MTADATADADPSAEPTRSGRRRFVTEGAGLLALGALALATGDRGEALAALRGRWRGLHLAGATPRAAPGVSVRYEGDELVVSTPAADPGVALNETAAQVFLACDGRTTVDAVARGLCCRYRVAPARARADAVAVVGALVRAGCLTLG